MDALIAYLAKETAEERAYERPALYAPTPAEAPAPTREEPTEARGVATLTTDPETGLTGWELDPEVPF